MASYSTNEFRSGLKIILDGDPYTIVENEFVKPGKGQAFNRVRIRNLKTGRTIERNFKSGDTVEAADVVETDMQYLYSDGDFWHFMVPDTFEQHTAGKEAMGESAQCARSWIRPARRCLRPRCVPRNYIGPLQGSAGLGLEPTTLPWPLPNPGQFGCEVRAASMPAIGSNKYRCLSAERPQGMRCRPCHTKQEQTLATCMRSTPEPPSCSKNIFLFAILILGGLPMSQVFAMTSASSEVKGFDLASTL